MSDRSPSTTLDTTSSINEAAFDMSEFLTNTTTPDSIDYVFNAAMADDMHFPIPDWSTYRQTRASHKHHGQVRILSDGDFNYRDDKVNNRMKLDDEASLPTGPRKARRQAQNRAAQRAFRERKEKYIQELEEKVVGMTKEISTLKRDRGRLQGLLNVAHAEIQTLKSIPRPVARSTSSSVISCDVTDEGKQTIVLAIEINVRGAPGSNQSTVDTSLVEGGSDAG